MEHVSLDRLFETSGVVGGLNAYYAVHACLPDDAAKIPVYHEAVGLKDLGEEVELYIKRTFPRS